MWNSMMERFQVFHKDSRSGITRLIMTVETDDGEYMPLSTHTVNYLKTFVAWDLLDKYPRPEDLADYFCKKEETKKLKNEEYRTEFRKWWNKEHRTEWRAVLENCQRGIFGGAPEREKKIIIRPKGNHETL